MAWTKTEYPGVFISESGLKCNVVYRNKWYSGFKTKEEAWAFKQKLVEKLPVKPGAGTFASFYQKYQDKHLYKKSFGTQTAFDGVINPHVIPHIGDKKLEDIDIEMIEDLISKAHKISVHLSNRVLILLNVIFNKAIEWDYLIKNPCKKIRKIPDKKKEKSFFTEEQLKEVISKLEGKYKYIALISVLAGARIGEVLGLQWQDIDFINNTITYDRQNGKRGISEKLKSPYGHATIRLNPKLKEYLQEWKIQCRSDLWLFPGNHYNGIESYHSIHGYWCKWFRKNNITFKGHIVSFHVFKHTYTYMMRKRNADPLIVMKACRHANPDMTYGTYGHVTDDEVENTIDLLDF